MSLVTALDTAVSGLKVAQLQVQNAANNIANASDPNYTRKTALQAPINLSDGGGGVQIIGYQRAVSDALNKTYNEAISSNSYQQTANNVFSSVKDIYGMSSDTVRLSTTLDDFVGAWQAYSSAPEDSVRARVVVSTASDFTAEIRRVSSQLDQLDTSLKQQQQDGINSVNDLLSRIDTLNKQVASTTALHQPTGNLEDQRDDAIRQLSGFMTIRVLPADQGRVRLITPNGFVVLDNEPVKFEYNNGDYETASGTNVNNILTGGSLQAISKFRADSSPSAADTDPASEVIRKLKDQLNSLASSFLSTTGSPQSFSAAYNSGATKAGELASGFFTGTNSSNISVNAALLGGTSTLKQSSANDVVAALNDSTRTFTADGVNIAGTSYTGYNSTMLGLIGSSINTVQGRADLSATTEETYKERFANVVGVNVDEELVGLTRYQSSYSAVARVVSMVREMFDTLENLV